MRVEGGFTCQDCGHWVGLYPLGEKEHCPNCVELVRLRQESVGTTRVFLKLMRELEEQRMLRLGGLEVLALDGIISGGRAREIGCYSIEEQRAFCRNLLENKENDS